VDHSGIEMGQGINTKVVQAIAFALGTTATVSQDLVSTIVPKSTSNFPNVSESWGSGTSESMVKCVIRACEAINKALAPYKSAGTWQQIVAAASVDGADLSAVGQVTKGADGSSGYPITCACTTVVELDVLTVLA
jgi:xanthine dehydrogenase molybdopterin-binding subunit B